MKRSVSLGISLFGLWLLLSGHYEALFLTFGVISCALVVWIAHRMDVADHEGHPIHLGPRALTYYPWLFWEIVKSNIEVALIILDPRLPISPILFKLRAQQKTELGHVILANSITLTPGTVTVDIDGDDLTVHSLTREGAESLMQPEGMNDRVAQVEGHPEGTA